MATNGSTSYNVSWAAPRRVGVITMLGSSNSVKLEKDLFDRVKKCADLAGYSSPQEFIVHVLEKELAKIEEGESDEEILKKLQGLGYIE
jgi:hypothetical protein